MKPKHYPDWPIYGSRRAFLAHKREQGKLLLAAISQMRCGMAYLPPAKDFNAAGHMQALEEWIKSDCAPVWRKGMSTLLRERLRVERDLAGGAHPFVVTGYRVFRSADAAHPIRTSTEVIRESPTHYTVEFPKVRER